VSIYQKKSALVECVDFLVHSLVLNEKNNIEGGKRLNSTRFAWTAYGLDCVDSITQMVEIQSFSTLK